GSIGSWIGLARRRALFLCLCCLLPLFRRLRPELLRKPLDAPLGVDELLPPREERVAVGADFEVQLRLGRPRLPGRPARAADLDFVVLRMDALPHSELLRVPGQNPIIPTPEPY